MAEVVPELVYRLMSAVRSSSRGRADFAFREKQRVELTPESVMVVQWSPLLFLEEGDQTSLGQQSGSAHMETKPEVAAALVVETGPLRSRGPMSRLPAEERQIYFVQQ